MKKKVLDKKAIAAYRRRQYMMMLADNGGEEPEQQWNMRVVAHPEDGYEMPQTTGNFSLVKQDGDEYFYQHDGSDSTGVGLLHKDYESLHWGVDDVTFKDCEHITSIDSYFLYGCSGLTSLDLSTLRNVVTIKDNFLLACSGLTSLNISQLSNVTSIAAYFLSGCSGLTSLDLSTLRNVVTIDTGGFLYGCSGLTSLDLSILSNITSVGVNFLYGCSGLTSLDLSPLSKVVAIYTHFLSGCSGLTSLDLSPLSKVVNIYEHFLSGCSGLTSLDLSNKLSLDNIKSNFLNGCTNLTYINATNWYNVKIAQDSNFMYRVPQNCQIDVDCAIVDKFKTESPWSRRADYYNCVEIEPPQYWNMKITTNERLSFISSAKINGFTLLSCVGNDYYYTLNDGVTSLTNPSTESIIVTYAIGIEFNDCGSILTLSNSFLKGGTTSTKYTKISSLDFSAFNNVNKINAYFLQYCKGLQSIKLPWTTIPTTTTNFMSSVPATCSIEVPCEAVEAYKTTSPWSKRASYIVGDC